MVKSLDNDLSGILLYFCTALQVYAEGWLVVP
jgi:hypothetical protein